MKLFLLLRNTFAATPLTRLAVAQLHADEAERRHQAAQAHRLAQIAAHEVETHALQRKIEWHEQAIACLRDEYQGAQDASHAQLNLLEDEAKEIQADLPRPTPIQLGSAE